MIVDLRNNPPRSQLAPSRIKLREVQTTQIVHKKRHVLTIRYFQTSLKIAIFTLWSLRFESNHETEREGKALKKKPLRSLETVAIFVFLIHVSREISLIQTPSYQSIPWCQRFFFPLAWSIRYRATSRGKKPSGHGGWEPHFHDLELWTQSLIGYRSQCQSFPSDNDLTPIFTGWKLMVLQKPVFSSRSNE